MPELKEPHFFGRDLYSPRFIRDEERYLSLFYGAESHKRAGEASVYYLCSKRAAKEIKEFSPSACIIIMLRNPADMIYSLHSQRLYSGHENISDFEAALEAEEERKRGLRCPKIPTPSWPCFTARWRDIQSRSEDTLRFLAGSKFRSSFTTTSNAIPLGSTQRL